MRTWCVSRAVQVVLLAAVLSCTGCAYLQNRGNDAADILDVGVTVSKEPTFSLYAGFLNVLSLGYSNFDGTMYGLGHRQFGALPARHHAGGLLLWGVERFGHGGDFDPAKSDSPDAWHVGIVGLIQGPAPRRDQVVNCPKMLHLGWAGLTLNCKFGELFDFLLGWTTLDLMGDDTAGKTDRPVTLPSATGYMLK